MKPIVALKFFWKYAWPVIKNLLFTIGVETFKKAVQLVQQVELDQPEISGSDKLDWVLTELRQWVKNKGKIFKTRQLKFAIEFAVEQLELDND